jgi:spore germination cell wall hydrolase CwlJ-like protein
MLKSESVFRNRKGSMFKKPNYQSYLVQFVSIVVLGLSLALYHKKQQFDQVSVEYNVYKENTEMLVTYFNAAFNNLQNDQQRMIALEAELTCLATNIYFESGKSYQEKLAIGTVTMNRVTSGDYPKNICAVVWQKKPGATKCQFAWTCDGKSDAIVNNRKYMESLKVAKEVLIHNRRSDIIDSRTTYFHANYVRPSWSRRVVYVATVGSHLFYKERSP